MMDLFRTKNIRIIIIDDNQIQYNHLMDIFQAQGYTVSAVLLDDLLSLQKHMKTTWDIIFYSKAYDFDQNKLFDLIKNSKQSYLPCLRLERENTTQNHYELKSDFFDQVNINHPKHLCFTFDKAMVVSFLWQEKQRLDKDVENIQNQIKSTSEHTKDASMVVQEGIVMENNQHVHEMFHIDDAFGMPLLDVLQPKNPDYLKQQLKLIDINSAQTYHLDIESTHTHLKNKKLHLKIFSNQEEESLHISIGQPQQQDLATTTVVSYHEQINQIIKHQNKDFTQRVLLSFSIKQSHTKIKLLSSESGVQQYIDNVTQEITKYFSMTPIKAGPFQWIGIIGMPEELTSPQIESRLIELLKQFSTPVQLGYCAFRGNLTSEAQFYWLFAHSKQKTIFNEVQESDTTHAQITNTVIDTPALSVEKTPEPTQVQNTTTSAPPQPNVAMPTPDLSSELLTNGSISSSPLSDDVSSTVNQYQSSVKYQQIYDKHDSNPHMFEVTTVFTDSNGISYNLNYADELPLMENSASIQMDQETIKTACQTLYQFCQTTPDANVIINLHHSSLDSPLTTYLATLLQQLPGLNAEKITLQFNALDIIQLNLQIHPTWAALRQMNIGVGLSHFNFNSKEISLLGQIQPKICFMALNLEQILSNGTQHQYIQEQFNYFKNTDFVIPQLNDMNEFANAWNVDCRYLQGQYFQEKLSQMVNI
ncbi:EAL domain-containing protein [Acinetobacter sp. B5B]|nr:EAL domain-containing protein [Acinetobacter baretiae]